MPEPAEPTPPSGVRVIGADGSSTELPIAYDGIEGDLHMWAILADEITVYEGDRLHVDRLPARTGLRFVAARREADHA